MREVIEFFKALSDETRLKILVLLHRQDMCVCELEAVLDVGQSNISQHLRILRASQLVQDHKEQQWTIYSLNREKFEELRDRFSDYFALPLGKLPDLEPECKRFNAIRKQGFRCCAETIAEIR